LHVIASLPNVGRRSTAKEKKRSNPAYRTGRLIPPITIKINPPHSNAIQNSKLNPSYRRIIIPSNNQTIINGYPMDTLWIPYG